MPRAVWLPIRRSPGQSVWYHNVARPGVCRRWPPRQLIDHDRVTGGTANPSIFAKSALNPRLLDEELAAAPASDSDAAAPSAADR